MYASAIIHTTCMRYTAVLNFTPLYYLVIRYR